MRTKPIIVAAAALLVVALAVAAWLRFDRPAPVLDEPQAEVVEEIAPGEIVDTVDPAPVFSDDTPPPLEASPQGLYDDLDAAFERAGKKPELSLERVPPPTLEPPQRDPDEAADEVPDPA